MNVKWLEGPKVPNNLLLNFHFHYDHFDYDKTLPEDILFD